MKRNKKKRKQDVKLLSVKEIKGKAISPGITSGRIRVILSLPDIQKCKEDSIVVISSMNISYFPLIRKAKAIITNKSGFLSHLAIICKELKIPCLILAKPCFRFMKEGDKVEINANKGIVRIM